MGRWIAFNRGLLLLNFLALLPGKNMPTQKLKAVQISGADAGHRRGRKRGQRESNRRPRASRDRDSRSEAGSADVPALISSGQVLNSGTLVALLHVLAISGPAPAAE